MLFPVKSGETIVHRFIEEAGNVTQSFGLGRAIGQIYALLYFSPEPGNLDTMRDALGISKGSASTAVRQLEQFGAVRKVWVKGDRRDYYEASEWFGRILGNAAADIVGRRMSAYAALLDEVAAEIAAVPDGDGEGAFLKDRIERLRKFQRWVQSGWAWDVVEKMLR